MNEEQTEIKEQKVEIEDIGIGEDKPMFEEGRYVVIGSEVEPVVINTKEQHKVSFVLEKEDKQVKCNSTRFLQNKKVKDSGIWLKYDNEHKILFRSALGNLLRFYKKNKIKDLIGNQVDTVLQESGYLAIKAY